MSFGQSLLFGQPSIDANMNLHYLNQAQIYAASNPGNVQAQRQLQYWQEVCLRQTQAALATAAAAPVGPSRGLRLPWATLVF